MIEVFHKNICKNLHYVCKDNMRYGLPIDDVFLVLNFYLVLKIGELEL